MREVTGNIQTQTASYMNVSYIIIQNAMASGSDRWDGKVSKVSNNNDDRRNNTLIKHEKFSSGTML